MHGMDNINFTDHIIWICQILEKHGNKIGQCIYV